MRLIRVQLVDAEEWPRCGNGLGAHEATAKKNAKRLGTKWADWRGKLITVATPPTIPDAHWICGSEEVFRVMDKKLLAAFGADETWPFYVCRHQIQVGD